MNSGGSGDPKSKLGGAARREGERGTFTEIGVGYSGESRFVPHSKKYVLGRASAMSKIWMNHSVRHPLRYGQCSKFEISFRGQDENPRQCFTRTFAMF